jgi:hypothetical protein
LAAGTSDDIGTLGATEGALPDADPEPDDAAWTGPSAQDAALPSAGSAAGHGACPSGVEGVPAATFGLEVSATEQAAAVPESGHCSVPSGTEIRRPPSAPNLHCCGLSLTREQTAVTPAPLDEPRLEAGAAARPTTVR